MCCLMLCLCILIPVFTSAMLSILGKREQSHRAGFGTEVATCAPTYVAVS